MNDTKLMESTDASAVAAGLKGLAMRDGVAAPGGFTATAYLGIDNGLTGALALLLPDDSLAFHPVHVRDLGKERLLDVRKNLAVLQEMARLAAARGCKLLTVFEQGPKSPEFGAKNNYTNGRNNEFWRVLLSIEQIPFGWVNPRRWQDDVFLGIRGDDTKQMAKLLVEQRFPRVTFPKMTKTEEEGIMDAICIALWAREHHP